jgi:hypothetical protein
MWREPEPAAPPGAREWLAELLQWCVRTTDYSRRAEQTLGNLCDAARVSMPDALALFRDLRACELHLVFVGGCVHCRLNIERRATAFRALRERAATLPAGPGLARVAPPPAELCACGNGTLEPVSYRRVRLTRCSSCGTEQED